MLTLPQNPQAQRLLTEIMATLRRKFTLLNHHYEAGWVDSFVDFRCWHEHATLIQAARCAASQGIPGWYCLAVEFGTPRELTDAEDAEVRAFRFGGVRRATCAF